MLGDSGPRDLRSPDRSSGQVAPSGMDRGPPAALVFCRPPRAAWTVIAGKPVVREGRIATVDMGRALAEHRRLTRELIDGG